MSGLEVARLVRLAQHGDRAAFDSLVQRFEADVFQIVVSRLGNAADAHDVTQEVFWQAFDKLPQLRQAACFSTWLRRIAERMALSRACRRSSEFAVARETLDVCRDAAPGPLENMLRRELAHRVWSGLDRLRALDRETLVAFYIDGWSLARMSREFASPVGTIKRRLHVARRRLRTQLRDLQPS